MILIKLFKLSESQSLRILSYRIMEIRPFEVPTTYEVHNKSLLPLLPSYTYFLLLTNISPCNDPFSYANHNWLLLAAQNSWLIYHFDPHYPHHHFAVVVKW